MNLAKSNVLLLILALALAVPTWMQMRGDAETFVDVSRIPLLFDGFTPDNVGQIVLAMPKKEQPPADPQNPDQKRPVAYDQLQIVRTDAGYCLGALSGNRANAPVNQKRVEDDVFAHLSAIRADHEAFVQPNANAEQLVQFGLDDEHAFRIRAIDKTGKHVVAELLVGREAGAGQTGTEAVRGVFVRKIDSTDVVLYEYGGAWRRDVDEETWLDKSLVRVDPDKVRRLSIRTPATNGATFVFERPDGTMLWRCVDPPPGVGAVRQPEIESYLQRMGQLFVQDYRLPLDRVPNKQQLGLEPANIELELKIVENGRERPFHLSVGGKVDDKEEVYVTSSESPFLMTWPATTASKFEADVRGQWFDPPPPQPRESPKEQAPAEQVPPKEPAPVLPGKDGGAPKADEPKAGEHGDAKAGAHPVEVPVDEPPK